jgi:hypothetical protein
MSFSRKNAKLLKLEARLGITDGPTKSIEERLLDVLVAMEARTEQPPVQR